MKLLIADDQTMLREALAQLLLLQEEISSVQIACNGQETIALLRDNEYDVVLLDIEMPHYSGLDVLEWIRRESLPIKVVMMTTFKRLGYFERAVALDVDAFVLKDRHIEELMQTIHHVLTGQKEYSPELVERLVKQKNPLTEQEIKILSEVANGLTNKAIAQKICLSSGTVRNYISSILATLNADNRTDAVRIARQNGWL